jgi:ATP-binding cassette subfamily C protein
LAAASFRNQVGFPAALTAAILTLKRDGKTVVVMAHRPSAIAAVDKLLMLAEGRMQVFGPKEEVLAQVAEPASAGSTG